MRDTILPTWLQQMSKIAIVGSTGLRDTVIRRVKERLEAAGHTVRTPAFDDQSELDSGAPEYDLMSRNREMVCWADEVVCCWDQRSVGTLVDVGMADTLGKPFHAAYLQPLTFANYLLQYQARNPAKTAMSVLGGEL